MGLLVLALYIAAGYWAVGETLWANKIIFGTGKAIFVKRVSLALAFGWILFPVAILKCLFFRKR